MSNWDELQEKTARRLEITADNIVADLEKVYQAAFQAKQYAAANRAKELQGKTLGMFADRVLIQDIHKVPDEELIREIVGGDPRREELARELLHVPDDFEDDSTRH